MRISDWSSDVCSSDLKAATLSGNVNAYGQTGASVTVAKGGVVGSSADNPFGGVYANADGTDYTTKQERSEEHTSELQSLMRISYAVFCLKNNFKHNRSTCTRH